MKAVFQNFRLIDKNTDSVGTVLVGEDGTICDVIIGGKTTAQSCPVFDGKGRLVLSPAFVDMHAHFRDPGFPEKETLESASLAAAKGGFGTVVCMANTKPVIDNVKLAQNLKRRSDSLGIIDLYPAISLTHAMEGLKLSCITEPLPHDVRLLSEDGKDIGNESLFLAALQAALKADKIVSCHCDIYGEEYSVARALELGEKSGCTVHIAHISTKKALDIVRLKKAKIGERISCEATPHHIALTRNDALKLGIHSFGHVAPPLREEEDRRALIEALCDGTVNAIATDHAPHTVCDKEKGEPGFSGLETAFAVCNTVLVKEKYISLQKLSCLMSAEPARLLGFSDRALLECKKRADLVVLDTESFIKVDPRLFYSRGKNTPFAGPLFYGAVLLTMQKGRIVYESNDYEKYTCCSIL